MQSPAGYPLCVKTLTLAVQTESSPWPVDLKGVLNISAITLDPRNLEQHRPTSVGTDEWFTVLDHHQWEGELFPSCSPQYSFIHMDSERLGLQIFTGAFHATIKRITHIVLIAVLRVFLRVRYEGSSLWAGWCSGGSQVYAHKFISLDGHPLEWWYSFPGPTADVVLVEPLALFTWPGVRSKYCFYDLCYLPLVSPSDLIETTRN
jgi:hypothetical protein